MFEIEQKLVNKKYLVKPFIRLNVNEMYINKRVNYNDVDIFEIAVL